MALAGIMELPNFCSHEHWGSITPIGPAPGGFRADTEAGATPSRPVSVWDLILDPYLGGWIWASGFDFNQPARAAGHDDFVSWWNASPGAAFDAIRPALGNHLLTGAFQCTRRGILHLHGHDIGQMELPAWQKADAAVRESYADLFGWYRATMAKARFTELIRPVHPEFYVQNESEESAEAELAFTSTILRVDPLLEWWPAEAPRRDFMANVTGIDPSDAASWRAFIGKIMDLAAEGKTTGTKQLQAYRRALDYEQPSDATVRFRGGLDKDEQKRFEDWVMHECFKQTNDRGWPHQMHIGTHNLAQSSPLPIEHIARAYPRQNLVMLHVWPFLDEAGYLMKQFPNIYADTCWEPVLSPAFFHEAMNTWLNYVPTHKITCAHDCTSIEMAVGSSLFTREILGEALEGQRKNLGLPADALLRVAADLLHNNAVGLYNIGERFEVSG